VLAESIPDQARLWKFSAASCDIMMLSTFTVLHCTAGTAGMGPRRSR
jgi:hypothetical protein